MLDIIKTILAVVAVSIIKEVVSSPGYNVVDLEDFLNNAKIDLRDQHKEDNIVDAILKAATKGKKHEQQNYNQEKIRSIRDFILQSNKRDMKDAYMHRHGYTQQVKPNNLLGNSDSDEEDTSYWTPKALVILNSKDLTNERNMNDLANVISDLLSPTSNVQMYHEGPRNNVFDTRLINKGVIRRKIESSKEIYAPNSLDEEYKVPKRVRSDFGNAMRTAIPYVRHRGDIYERDV